MSLLDASTPTTTAAEAIAADRPEVRPVVLDLYRDIHKGIRSELFALTLSAGRTDPADRAGRAAVAAHLRDTVALLVSHAEHEDAAIQPAIEVHLPDLAVRMAAEHAVLEARMDDLVALAAVVEAEADRHRLHQLYVELADFTSAYLAHQDAEERRVMPALEAAVGVDAVVAMHGAIVSSIPPEEMASSLSLMLPAMNLDDRADLLAGLAAGAPAEVVEGVWHLAGSVLEPADRIALAARLGRDA